MHTFKFTRSVWMTQPVLIYSYVWFSLVRMPLDCGSSLFVIIFILIQWEIYLLVALHCAQPYPTHRSLLCDSKWCGCPSVDVYTCFICEPRDESWFSRLFSVLTETKVTVTKRVDLTAREWCCQPAKLFHYLAGSKYITRSGAYRFTMSAKLNW